MNTNLNRKKGDLPKMQPRAKFSIRVCIIAAMVVGIVILIVMIFTTGSAPQYHMSEIQLRPDHRGPFTAFLTSMSKVVSVVMNNDGSGFEHCASRIEVKIDGAENSKGYEGTFLLHDMSYSPKVEISFIPPVLVKDLKAALDRHIDALPESDVVPEKKSN